MVTSPSENVTQTEGTTPPGAGAAGDSSACRLSGDAGHRGANMGTQVTLDWDIRRIALGWVWLDFWHWLL